MNTSDGFTRLTPPKGNPATTILGDPGGGRISDEQRTQWYKQQKEEWAAFTGVNKMIPEVLEAIENLTDDAPHELLYGAGGIGKTITRLD